MTSGGTAASRSQLYATPIQKENARQTCLRGGIDGSGWASVGAVLIMCVAEIVCVRKNRFAVTTGLEARARARS